MSTKPTQIQDTFSEVSEIVSEYTEWYNQVLRYLLFVNEMEETELPERNTDLFKSWITKAKNDDLLEEGIFQKLYALYEDFHKLIEELVWKAKNKKQALGSEDFDQLTNFFEEFLRHLRRLERDSSLKDNGIDVMTGLRHRSIMKEDLEKEMERLSRRGRPFSLALAKIDQYAKIEEALGLDEAVKYTKITAELIKRSVRSFDDAYRLNNGLFLLSLKQADVTGGLAALERLKRLLENQDVRVKIKKKDMPMTISCCIAEPVDGDNIDDLLTNLKKDLSKVKDSDGAVLEYYEMSPLQRFIKEDKTASS